ncbi:MAG: acyl-ACP--UDP-N-acetylglucosamine O-acyltransferase [Rhodobacteraceae bacterium]|nr:acyl-ACP--UDP-N-acetylglucosamine O-acyltransferase [Paracoccaceae bacterium]
MAVHPSAELHPSAVIENGAEIGPGCSIGPFCLVGAQVRLAANVMLKSHVVLTGDTGIGEGTKIFSFAVIGEIPQDMKYRGEQTRLIIGAHNTIREHVTINAGTAGGGGVTRIGDDGLFLAGCHIAHDTQVGNRVIVVNSAAIAGHCVIEDDVLIGGLCGIHQFVRIGRGAIIGAVTMVTHDVIPYGLVHAARGELEGLNLIGLKRRGASKAEITALRAAFQTLSDGEGSFLDRVRSLKDEAAQYDHIAEIVDFILGPTERSFLTPG